MMSKPPPGRPQILSAVFYREPLAAIDWLCKAFGFEIAIRAVGKDGTLQHAELRVGEGAIMIGGEGARPGDPDSAFRSSPLSLGGKNTQAMMVYVGDVDALWAQARTAGAKITSEPKDNDYGPAYWADRNVEIEDLEGHRWWFVQRMRG